MTTDSDRSILADQADRADTAEGHAGGGGYASPLGRSVTRVEDQRLLTGQGRYAGDIAPEGAAHLTFVGSPVAHAVIRSIDVDAAAAAPGVVAVVTAADLDIAPRPPHVPAFEQRMARPYLADGVVRYVGEPVAAVVAETQAQAVDAAELVDVDYEPLPAVVGPRLAADDETLLFPEAGSNVCHEVPADAGADPFADCEVVVDLEMTHQRMAACPIEPRAAVADWRDGRLTFFASTQSAHRMRERLCNALGLEPHQVRVVTPEVGGAFGAKPGGDTEEVVVGWAARRLGRPVRWAEIRTASMTGMHHGRALAQEITIGGRRDGTVLAYRNRVTQDMGAYPEFPMSPVARAVGLASGVYAIPRVECHGRAVVTTTTPVGAVRGAGRPEANIAVERAMDAFAREIGMDPAEVRRKNLVPADAFPYTTPTGSVYDSGDYHRLLETVLDAGHYDKLRAEQERRRAAGDPVLLGVGLGLFVEIAGGSPLGEYGAVEVVPEGRAVLRTGSTAHGQGHQTTFAQVVSDRLGIPMDRVEVRYGDTDEVPAGVGTFGSRSAQLGGSAAHLASLQVLDQAKRLAAELLEANPADIALDREASRLTVAGSPTKGFDWAELARAAADAGQRLFAEVPHTQAREAAWPSGAVLAAVEVDSETGRVTVRSLVTCDDVGLAINPLVIAGQVHGGLALGVAHALLEEFVYDADGNPLTANLSDYPAVTADVLPSFELHHVEIPSPGNELGVKGVGEAGTVGAPAAVLNAVIDALAHLGVRHISPPATPAKVLAAIPSASK